MNPDETPGDSTARVLNAIRVVLIDTSHPGNIGSAARAVKTMGLARLVLVRPKRFPDAEATALASGAADVLEAATVCDTLDAALAGTVFSVALSARSRDLSHAPMDARAAAAELVRVARGGEVALVFGNETAGLANDEVLRCSTLAHIPANRAYSSLNLAQAVQVLAYEARMAALGAAFDIGVPPRGKPVPEAAPHEDVENFYAHLERALEASGFLDPRNPRRLMERLRRLFGRVRLEREEVNILRGMLSAWEQGPPPPSAPGRK